MTLNRQRTILRISQAHVAPGMSLTQWEAIATRHGLALTGDALAWEQVSAGDLRAMVDEIAAVVKAAKEGEL